jgi:molybdenum cofactor cytidylyltransferase
MGQWKMLMPLQGKPVIRHTVENALQICHKVILVTGFRGQELRQVFVASDRVEVVFNPHFEEGMFTSVKRGLERVESEQCFIVPGDMPMVGASVYRELLRFQRTDCVIPKHNGRLGHPVLLGKDAIEKIKLWNKAGTLRDCLDTIPTLSVPISDFHILDDLDTLEDYRRLRDG